MIRYLKTFVVAAHTASFSLTGARLGLTQSAVSTQIKRLEDTLNCLLFERMGKSIALSPHGKALLPTAQEILRLYESMHGHAAEGFDSAGTIVLRQFRPQPLG